MQQQCSKRTYFGGSPPPDFDPKKDYYKMLEVNEKASQTEIKNAFYRLAQFYHPDRNNGLYTEKFKDITAAYQVLNDEKRRKRYDALRKGEDDPEGFKNPFSGWRQQQGQ
jgi:DnaJ-class molecular chaperone